MSDNNDDSYDVYGDTDPNNVPDGGFGQDTSAGDGLPGYPVDGQPDWRAGMFGSGRGLLGMARVSDLAPQPSGDDQAPVAGRSDPRLMRVSDPVLDWEQNSWRWNDPEALAYDLDRKKRQLADAQGMANALGSAGGGQTVASLVGKRLYSPIGALANPEAGVAGLAVGTYMGSVEAPRIQGEIKALQNRLNQLGNRSKT
jgi:hypothetical protein